MVVGYPATPLLLARSRVCISAAHTYALSLSSLPSFSLSLVCNLCPRKKDLEFALTVIEEVLQEVGGKYKSKCKVTTPPGLLIA